MRRAARTYAYGATLGFFADLALGDPERRHPVAAFGRVAAAWERALWRDNRAAGALYTALCVGGVSAGAAALSRAVATVPTTSTTSTTSATSTPLAPVALTACVTWTVLGGTSLTREARAIGDALAADEVDEARRRLPRLCGRDPQALDAEGIARATVESVAENTSDAVVGTLVWGALADVPGLAAHRAVNTLDAMLGHRSTRHLRFGWAAARLDDVAGWPGARLTAALTAAAGPHPRTALRVWRRDAGRHPSPNAGPVEAAFAGALDLRLGGALSYGGRRENRPVLHADGARVRAADIERAVRLSRRVGVLALIVTCALGTLRCATAGRGERG